MNGDPLLTVDDLKVNFRTLRGVVHALQGVSFHINRQETLGLVGETGCGKSVTARAVLRLIAYPGQVAGGRINFEGRNILDLSEAEMRSLRGSQISMIMQEPKMSLNPVIRVGRQVSETLLINDHSMTRKAAANKAVDMLAQLNIPDPVRVARRFPHELSGGMAQRIMIAMMLVTRPKLLIADEPTSALDVTIQAQILKLMNKLIQEIQTSVLLITHDLGVMAESCDRVAVMYAGQIVEIGPVREVLKNPQHPYTKGLLKTLPENASPDEPLFSIKGAVPTLLAAHKACGFAPRCDYRFGRCDEAIPHLHDLGSGRHAACFLLDDPDQTPQTNHNATA